MKTRAVLAVGGALAAVSFASAILLLPTFLSLIAQKAEVARELGIEMEKDRQVGTVPGVENLARIEALAAKVLQYENSHPGSSALIESIIKDAPPGLVFNTLSFRPAAKQLTIEGFAPSRALLLGFLENLEVNPLLKNVSSPLANIIKEADIKFFVTLTVE